MRNLRSDQAQRKGGVAVTLEELVQKTLAALDVKRDQVAHRADDLATAAQRAAARISENRVAGETTSGLHSIDYAASMLANDRAAYDVLKARLDTLRDVALQMRDEAAFTRANTARV